MDLKLISAMTEFPELYNKTLSAYRDTVVKERAWTALSDRLRITEKECRKRWKNLRDIFTRRVKADRLRGANGDHLRRWRYSQHMTFLLPYIKSSRSSTGSNSGEEDTRDEGAETASNSDAQNDADGSLSGTKGDDKPKVESPTSNDSHVAAFRWQVPLDWQAAAEGDNEDEMFFMSLLPHLKRLPYKKKCSLKLKFHQLLHEAEFDES